MNRSRTEDQVMDAALAWCARLNSGHVSVADRAAFRDWIESDPRHARAFEEAERLWTRAGAAAVRIGGDGWYRRRPRRWAPALAAAAVLFLAVLGAGWRDPGILDRMLADHATGPGVSRMVTLADGSGVFLDTDSAIAVDLEPHRRTVRLIRGRAWFDVAHDADAPFTVTAGLVETRVLGTAFAVSRGRDAATVTVERGEVDVALGHERTGVRLVPGQRLTLGPGTRRGPDEVEPEIALAWRRGLLVFDRAPLSEVAAALERMVPGRFVVAGENLRRETLSGTFRVDNPEAVLAALGDAMGLKTAGIPGFTTLIYR